MAFMNGPKGYVITLDDDIVRAATEASNRKIDAFAKILTADFEARAVMPQAWEIDEFAEPYWHEGE